MTNRDRMQSALKQLVFPVLRERGFEGTYPHFRRKREDCLELISFATDKCGGSFSVGASVAFPKGKNTNLIYAETEQDITVFSTKKRYLLPGMYAGIYFYSDVYAKQVKGHWFRSRTDYVGALTKEKAAAYIDDGYICVKQFSSETPAEICGLIDKQLENAFLWMEKFEKKNRCALHRPMLKRRRRTDGNNGKNDIQRDHCI